LELALEVLFWPFVACLVITGIHVYLGLHVVSRGVIFVDLALAQIAAMGATFAFLLGYPPDGNQAYFYSLLFALIGAAIFSISRLREQQIPQEAIIGITFAVASATTILIADRSPHGAEFVEAMLTGALLWVPREKIFQTALVYAAVGLLHWVFRDRFLAITLEPERAETEGWSVRWWDFLFYASFGLVITLSVSIAGVLLVFSFLVIPAVIAMMLTQGTVKRLTIGWVAGTLVSTVGLWASYVFDFPSGPAVVVTFGLALVLAATARYVALSDRPPMAASKVLAGAAVIVAGLWLSFYAASLQAGHVEDASSGAGPVSGAAPDSGAAPNVDAAELVSRALQQLEASPDDPPADDVESLLSASEAVHLMMSTGEIVVSENAVRALANAPPDDERVTDLLDEIAFHAPDPWVRMRASQALLVRRDSLGIQAMLELLALPQPILLQLEGIGALHGATGQEFGYDAEGDAASKGEALARWREWWAANASDPFVSARDITHR